MKKMLILSGLFVLISGLLFTAVSYENGEKVMNTAPFEEGVAMLMISHTEYWSGETGQIIGKLVDYNLDPIIVNYCEVDAWYPNNKSLFLDSQTTTDTLQSTTGTHYVTFTTPEIEGVYEYQMTCEYNRTPSQTRNVTTSNSFHLNPALNYLRDINDSLWTKMDGVEITVDEIQLVVNDINGTVNDIRSDQFTKEMAQTNFTFVNERLDQISTNLTVIQQFCDNPETEGSSLCVWVNDTNDRITNIQTTVDTNNEIILQLNSTSNNIYDYMTVDLTNIVNGMFGTVNETLIVVSDINTTVNQISTDITEINTEVGQVNETVSDIRNTQIDVIYMSVFSG